MVKKKAPQKKKEKISKESPKEIQELEEKGSESLPPYPPEKTKGEEDSSPGISEEFKEEEEIEDEGEPTLSPEEIENICGDIYGGFYEIWKVFNPKVRSLEDREKKQVKRVIARIAIKNDLHKHAKDEFLLLFYASIHVGTRLKELKSDKNHSRKKGKGEDVPLQGTDK